MATTDGKPDYVLTGNAMIDGDHAHFAELLERCRNAEDAELPGLLDEMIAHFEAHFAREEALMEETGFPPAPIHRSEHRRVLAWAATVREEARAGDGGKLRPFLTERIVRWFIDHAASMDSATANWAASQGH